MRLNFSYGSICSGIEAATVAWHPLGWRAAWFSEIEPAPSAVLAYRWPDVPNLGDMTKLARFVRAGLIEAPDALVGGTPCQAFSLAGLRGGLTDARGQLTLTYVDLANAIDEKRIAAGLAPCVIYWENVPGVLSDATNAFGCFLGALAGEDVPLECAGGKWPHAGLVVGPQRAIAWRVLDAQYFGLAQRRRRVFVVASARDGFDPATILFELGSVRRDSPPRRETGQDVAGTLTQSLGKRCGQPDCGSTPGQLICASTAEGGSGVPFLTCSNIGKTVNNQTPLRAMAFDARQECVSSTEVFGALGSSSPQAQAVCVTAPVTHTLKAEGFDASEDGTGRGQPIVAFQTRGSNLDVGDIAGTIGTNCDRATGSSPMAQYGMAVRRLTPRECERLQGFPDDYTRVPVERRAPGRRTGLVPPMADGPRYKALGNSMAVLCMRWLGMRLILTHPEYFY